jgi:hypothetical protein
VVKDRVGNKLLEGQKVLVALPEAQIFGFVAKVEEGGLITGVRGARGGVEERQGRILVSCVIALPVDAGMGIVPQLVRVHDPDKHEEPVAAEDRPN